MILVIPRWGLFLNQIVVFSSMSSCYLNLLVSNEEAPFPTAPLDTLLSAQRVPATAVLSWRNQIGPFDPTQHSRILELLFCIDDDNSRATPPAIAIIIGMSVVANSIDCLVCTGAGHNSILVALLIATVGVTYNPELFADPSFPLWSSHISCHFHSIETSPGHTCPFQTFKRRTIVRAARFHYSNQPHYQPLSASIG